MRFKEFLAEAYSDLIKYNKDVFFPPNWIKDVAKFLVSLPSTLRNSYHVELERSYKHNYIVKKDDLTASSIFELQYSTDGKLVKVGFRLTKLDPKRDIIVIISNNGVIVTTWTNNKNDVHSTLQKSNYATQWITA